MPVTVPRIEGIPWRYCTRWDEQPAAMLGKSLLRLGICRMDDWSGSAVDFVERGYKRFCKQNGADVAAKVWDCHVRIMDFFLFDLNELERSQVRGEMNAPGTQLYLVGDYSSVASIPIGAALSHLRGVHQDLAAACYKVFTDNLAIWMWAYDYADAREHAEMCMEGLEPEELKDSVYPKVEGCIPGWLKAVSELSSDNALRSLCEFQARLRNSAAQSLVQHILEMDHEGTGREHAWPGRLTAQVPGLEDYLNDVDGCVPGCVLSWHEGDEINACFDEQASTFGQNGPLSPSILLTLQLDIPMTTLDEEVRRVLDYVGAMVRSLAAAAKAVEIIREIDDERVRKDRVQPGLQVEQGTPALWEEQL